MRRWSPCRGAVNGKIGGHSKGIEPDQCSAAKHKREGIRGDVNQNSMRSRTRGGCLSFAGNGFSAGQRHDDAILSRVLFRLLSSVGADLPRRRQHLSSSTVSRPFSFTSMRPQSSTGRSHFLLPANNDVEKRRFSFTTYGEKNTRCSPGPGHCHPGLRGLYREDGASLGKHTGDPCVRCTAFSCRLAGRSYTLNLASCKYDKGPVGIPTGP
jgi:hypothetical protein